MTTNINFNIQNCSYLKKNACQQGWIDSSKIISNIRRFQYLTCNPVSLSSLVLTQKKKKLKENNPSLISKTVAFKTLKLLAWNLYLASMNGVIKKKRKGAINMAATKAPLRLRGCWTCAFWLNEFGVALLLRVLVSIA